jgi:hypothetical protein
VLFFINYTLKPARGSEGGGTFPLRQARTCLESVTGASGQTPESRGLGTQLEQLMQGYCTERRGQSDRGREHQQRTHNGEGGSETEATLVSRSYGGGWWKIRLWSEDQVADMDA